MACCPFRTLLYAVIAYIAIIYLLLPHPRLEPQSYVWQTCPPFLGPLTKNFYLDQAERLFEGELGPGPESIEVRDGVMYTGLEDGRIVSIKDKQVKTIVHIGGKDCIPKAPISEEKACGRPLGLRFDSEGNLVVADCIKGMYKLNVKTGKVIPIFNGSAMVDGVASNFIDDMSIAKNGDIYISDACAKWDYSRFFGCFIEGLPDGRLLHYDAKTKKLSTLVDNLYFPNGVQLTESENAVLFSQSTRSQIMKYHLKGPKAGHLEILIDNLPGIPDNIRPSGRGTYWVALYNARLPERPSFNERISHCSFTKRIFYTTFALVAEVTGWLQRTLAMPIIDVVHHELEQFIRSTFVPAIYGIIIEIDENGQILRSLHSPKAVVHTISQVTEDKGILYIGSPHNPFIGKVNVPA